MTEVFSVEQFEKNIAKRKSSEKLVLLKKERTLKAEWRRQSQILADFCAPKLGMSKKEYIASLPPFVDQPEQRRLFSIPLIVETRIGWRGLARAAEFATTIEFRATTTKEFRRAMSKIVDWKDDPKKFKTPDKPYTAWTSKGPLYVNRAALDVRKELINTGLAEYYRGGTIFDALALVIFHPEVVKGHHFELVGSQVKTGYSELIAELVGSPGKTNYLPSLNWFGERPVFEIGWHGFSDPHWGSLICSREIGT